MGAVQEASIEASTNATVKSIDSVARTTQQLLSILYVVFGEKEYKGTIIHAGSGRGVGGLRRLGSQKLKEVMKTDRDVDVIHQTIQDKKNLRDLKGALQSIGISYHLQMVTRKNEQGEWKKVARITYPTRQSKLLVEALSDMTAKRQREIEKRPPSVRKKLEEKEKSAKLMNIRNHKREKAEEQSI